MPRLLVPWLLNLGLPLVMLLLSWGCGGRATLIEPVKITKASSAPKKPRPLKSPAPTPRPTPRRPSFGR